MQEAEPLVRETDGSRDGEDSQPEGQQQADSGEADADGGHGHCSQQLIIGQLDMLDHLHCSGCHPRQQTGAPTYCMQAGVPLHAYPQIGSGSCCSRASLLAYSPLAQHGSCQASLPAHQSPGSQPGSL